ncbi:MAG: AAA family ATPase, partial [Terriglobales bacterium]
MKLNFVEIAGFRGFREKTRFDFPAGFAVLTGRNGVGKSTVLDAIDFAVTGTINKFAFKSAKGGGLDEHIWWVGRGRAAENYVLIGFVDEEGGSKTIMRARGGSVRLQPDGLLKELCGGSDEPSPISPDTFMRTTLIRDETLMALSLDLPEQQRFAAMRDAIGSLAGPDYTLRVKTIYGAAESYRDRQRGRLQKAQNELGRALTELTEARSVAERSTGVSDALRAIDELLPLQYRETTDTSEAVRAYIADRKRELADVEHAIDRSRKVTPQLAYMVSPEAEAVAKQAHDQYAVLNQQKRDADRLLAVSLSRLATEQESDSYTARLTALVQHGTSIGLQDGHCPLCDAERTREEFDAAVERARLRLAARGESLLEAARDVEGAQTGVGLLSQQLAAAEQALSELERRRLAASEELQLIAQIFAHSGFKGDPENPDAASQLLLMERERLVRLERALFVLEASLAADRISSLESRIATLREVLDKESQALSDAEGTVKAAHQIEASAQSVRNQILTEQFDTVMPLLKELYRRLRPHADWKEIEADFGGKVRASLNFTVGEGHN